jgi:hypothetical protein
MEMVTEEESESDHFSVSPKPFVFYIGEEVTQIAGDTADIEEIEFKLK